MNTGNGEYCTHLCTSSLSFSVFKQTKKHRLLVMFSPDAASYEHCSAYEIVFTLEEADNSLPASREACQAFSTLSTLAARGNDERYADFISAGAPEAIIVCLDNYGSDEVIALHSCIALYGLTRHSSDLTAFVVECGGIESILQCIPFHVGDALVCFHATNALLGFMEPCTHVSRMWMYPQIGSILDQLCYAGLNIRQKTSSAIATNVSLLLVRMLESVFYGNDNDCNSQDRNKKNHEHEDHDDDVIASGLDSISLHQHLSDSSTVTNARMKPKVGIPLTTQSNLTTLRLIQSNLASSNINLTSNLTYHFSCLSQPYLR